jgi:hypothetical protein
MEDIMEDEACKGIDIDRFTQGSGKEIVIPIPEDNGSVEKPTIDTVSAIKKIKNTPPPKYKNVGFVQPEMADSFGVGEMQPLPKDVMKYYKVLDGPVAGQIQQLPPGKLGSLEENVNGVFVKLDGERYPIFNGAIRILEEQLIMGRDNKVEEIDYLIQAVGLNSEPQVFTIKRSALIKTLQQTIESNCPELTLYTATPNFSFYFKQFVNNIVSRKGFRRVKKFKCSGWTEIGGQKMVYVNGNMQNVESKIKLPVFTKFDVCSGNGLLMNLMSQDPKLYVIFIFSHLGYAARLFQKADFEAHFSLFVSGETGSFKTTLLEALSGNLFDSSLSNSTLSKEARFESTKAALGARIADRVDSLLLVDDYHPAINKYQKCDMQANLEYLLRVFGDCNDREKLGPDRKTVISNKVCGALWMTGEYTDFAAYSDVLRVINIPFTKNTVDAEKLAAITSNRTLIAKYYAGFIKFLEVNFENIVNSIRQGKNNSRTYWKTRLGMDYGRYVDAAATLGFLNTIIWDAAASYGVSDAAKWRNFGSQAVDVFFANLVAAVKAADPRNMMLEIIADIFSNHEIQITDTKEKYIKNLGAGYFDQDNGLLVVNTNKFNEAYQRECISRGLAETKLNRSKLQRLGLITNQEKGPTRQHLPRTRVYAFNLNLLNGGKEGVENNV